MTDTDNVEKITESDAVVTRIGDIESYYGGLSVKAEQGKYFWSIKDCTGDFWVEIPERLYEELVEYETARREEGE